MTKPKVLNITSSLPLKKREININENVKDWLKDIEGCGLFLLLQLFKLSSNITSAKEYSKTHGKGT